MDGQKQKYDHETCFVIALFSVGDNPPRREFFELETEEKGERFRARMARIRAGCPERIKIADGEMTFRRRQEPAGP
jgi:hypothetical protein